MNKTKANANRLLDSPTITEDYKYIPMYGEVNRYSAEK